MSEPHAPAQETDSRPERAGLVLASLIAVATVANLNLSVANVAIPEIGDDFDSSADDAQPHRGRVLVRPRSVGAVVRSARRSLRPQAAHRRRDDALDPGLVPRRIRMERRRLVRCPRSRRALRGHGLPDDAGADHRSLVGTRPDQVDRPVVCHWWRLRRARAARERDPPRVLRLGIGLPGHDPSGASSRSRWPCISCPATSTRRPRRSTTSAGSSPSCSWEP